MKQQSIIAGLVIIVGIGFAAYLFNPFAEEAKGIVNTLGTNGIAIKGYDPVAYFTERAPREGKPDYTVEYKGAKWLFVSEKNKALFEANPERYEPAYGGYCAYGVAQNYLVKIEPEAWAIRNDQLYLNYDLDTQKRWSETPDSYIEQANEKWPELTAKQ